MLRKMQKILAITIMLMMLLSVACYAEDVEDIAVAEEEAEPIVLTSSEEDSEAAAELTMAEEPADSVETTDAVEEVKEEATTAEDVASEEVTTTGTSAEEGMLSNDVYLIDSSINYSRTVDGNAYIIGNDIEFSSMIGGDVFILGNNVKIGQNALIYGNLYVLANSLQLDGYVYGGDLYVACSEFTMSDTAIVNRDIRAAAGKVSINGGIGRNVYVDSTELTIGESTRIYGDLNYTTPTEVQVPSGSVKGTINYEEAKEDTESTSNPVLDYITDLAQFIVLVLAMLGVSVLIAPKFLNKIENTENSSILPSLAYGIIGLIAAIPVAIILFMTVIGTSTAFTLIFAWCLLVFIVSTPIAVISIAGKLASKVEALQKAHNILAVIIVAVLAWAVKLIPFVGGLISLLIVVYGLGLLMRTVWKSRKPEQE